MYQLVDKTVAHYRAVNNLDVITQAVLLKILDGTQVNIGSVVPVIRQGRRYRHLAFNGNMQAATPVTKVWKRYDATRNQPSLRIRLSRAAIRGFFSSS